MESPTVRAAAEYDAEQAAAAAAGGGAAKKPAMKTADDFNAANPDACVGGASGLNGCAFTYAEARDTPPLQRFGETKARRAPGQGGQRTGGVSSCGSEQGSGARRGSQAYPAISARNERQIFVASVFPAPLSPAQHTGSVGQLGSAACGFQPSTHR